MKFLTEIPFLHHPNSNSRCTLLGIVMLLLYLNCCGFPQNSSPGRQQGRVFLPGSILMKNYTANKIDSNDTEDSIPWPKNSSAEIRSEIWNYMLTKAEKLAGLREDKEPVYSVLAFKLLDMCKKLIQNTCPDHYIKDTIYDVATAVFINVQNNAFKFEGVTTDFPTEQRIVKALTQCLENFTEPYPFVDRRFNFYNETFSKCRIELGTYRYNNFVTEELQVAPNISSLSYDPVIDTCWHIFTHAHSACYSFFIHSDHHRFTTIMMPLFTNAINDIWYRGNFSLKEEADPYSTALGKLYNHMMYINHCSTFSRLESEYPWDLLRPERRQESTRKRRNSN